MLRASRPNVRRPTALETVRHLMKRLVSYRMIQSSSDLLRVRPRLLLTMSSLSVSILPVSPLTILLSLPSLPRSFLSCSSCSALYSSLSSRLSTPHPLTSLISISVLSTSAPLCVTSRRCPVIRGTMSRSIQVMTKKQRAAKASAQNGTDNDAAATEADADGDTADRDDDVSTGSN